MNDRLDSLPAREEIWVESGWRVAHAFDSSLPGWLVLVPTRHITAMEDLTSGEATGLGPMLQKASRALREVTGCAKSYVMFFAERDGFAHLHVHLVPRMPWFTDEQTGPRVFHFLQQPRELWLSEDVRDDVAHRLREAVRDVRPTPVA